MRLPLAILTLFAACAFLAPASLAQVDFGVRAGLNVSTFTGDAEDSEAKLGFIGGGYLNYAFSPTLSIQPEVLFSQKGAEFTEDNLTVTYRLDYIDVPVLLKYTLPTGTNLLPSLYAGPQVSFKVSESVRAEGISVDTEFIKSTDFGLTFGADVGARLAGRTQQFGVGLRYFLGLADIQDFEDGEGSLRNNVFTVSAYFGF